jgi:hypothetical protein
MEKYSSKLDGQCWSMFFFLSSSTGTTIAPFKVAPRMAAGNTIRWFDVEQKLEFPIFQEKPSPRLWEYVFVIIILYFVSTPTYDRSLRVI